MLDLSTGVRSGRTTSLNRDARDKILALVIRHGARHPALETIEFDEIHDQCLAELYRLLRNPNRPAMFRYLYIKWYSRVMFSKWSMAGGPRFNNFIPIGRTTMVVESHWHDLKHRWHREIHRPRLDYVLYKLDKDIMPAIAHRLQNSSLVLWYDALHWWRSFRRIWIDSMNNGDQEELLSQAFDADLFQWKCRSAFFRQAMY